MRLTDADIASSSTNIIEPHEEQVAILCIYIVYSGYLHHIACSGSAASE